MELTISELEAWIPKLVNKFSNKQIVLLNGTLGAGKTEFVRKVVKHWGCDEGSSPTYSLINSYSLSDSREAFHVDLYRLEKEEDLESIGFWDLFANEMGLIFVEWADKIPKSKYPLHWDILEITILKTEDDTLRSYTVL